MQSVDERVKEDFAREGLLHARTKTWEALERIAAMIQPGMLEDEATRKAHEITQAMGSPTIWHKPLIRFGRNTLCTFSEKSEPGARLGENDIFFVDLGPVWEHRGIRYEGDAGITGFVGSDPEHKGAAQAVRELFDSARTAWKEGGLSGKALYDWMDEESRRKGWKLQLKTDGHRISDFPHKLYCSRGIAELDYSPSPDIWVLEVQVRHPERDFGAFYEDILT
jgi:Xaa-Pro aminopeptidase